VQFEFDERCVGTLLNPDSPASARPPRASSINLLWRRFIGHRFLDGFIREIAPLVAMNAHPDDHRIKPGFVANANRPYFNPLGAVIDIVPRELRDRDGD
jgi:hypothetical protein